MEVCGKFRFLALLGAFGFLSIGHCADEVDGLTERMPQTAREFLQSKLLKSGAMLGYDDECKVVTAIGSQRFCDNDAAQNFDCDVCTEYDFKDEPTDRFEIRRVKSAWKAYADAAYNAVKVFYCACAAAQKQDHKMANCFGSDFMCPKSQKPNYICVLTSATSAQPIGNKMCFEEAIAVRVCVNSNLSAKSGNKTLREWLDNLKDNMTIGPASFCDSSGCVWNVGIVPVEEDVVLSEKKAAGEEVRQAKIMAYEIACRIGCVAVEWHESVEGRMIDERQKTKYRRSVRIRPLNAPSMTDTSRVKWFSVVGTDRLTAKKIRKYVCAIQEVVPSGMCQEQITKGR